MVFSRVSFLLAFFAAALVCGDFVPAWQKMSNVTRRDFATAPNSRIQLIATGLDLSDNRRISLANFAGYDAVTSWGFDCSTKEFYFECPGTCLFQLWYYVNDVEASFPAQPTLSGSYDVDHLEVGSFSAGSNDFATLIPNGGGSEPHPFVSGISGFESCSTTPACYHDGLLDDHYPGSVVYFSQGTEFQAPSYNNAGSCTNYFDTAASSSVLSWNGILPSVNIGACGLRYQTVSSGDASPVGHCPSLSRSLESTWTSGASFPNPIALGANDFTIECWVKFDPVNNGGSFRNIVSATFATGGGQAFEIETMTEEIRLVLRQDPNSSPTWEMGTAADYGDTTWHHFAIVRTTPGGVTFYKDGEPVSTINTGPLDCGEGCNIGTVTVVIGKGLVGNIDDVRIWTVARTATQILDNRFATLTGNEAGLSAYATLNGEASEWVDIVSGNALVHVGTPAASPVVPPTS